MVSFVHLFQQTEQIIITTKEHVQSHFNVVPTSINKRTHFPTNKSPWFVYIHLKNSRWHDVFQVTGKNTKIKVKFFLFIFILFFVLFLSELIIALLERDVRLLNLMSLIQELHSSRHACKPSSNNSYFQLWPPIMFRLGWK